MDVPVSHRNHNIDLLVGTGRFELPTPRTPSECSTRLSHVPLDSMRLCGLPPNLSTRLGEPLWDFRVRPRTPIPLERLTVNAGMVQAQLQMAAH